MEFVPCAAARPLGLQVVASYMVEPGQAPGGRLPGKCPRLDLEIVNDAGAGLALHAVPAARVCLQGCRDRRRAPGAGAGVQVRTLFRKLLTRKQSRGQGHAPQSALRIEPGTPCVTRNHRAVMECRKGSGAYSHGVR